ncbi:MAG: DNA alkylation repair protein [Flavobacteriales bacterium]|nr:MAG: DNA alkylation repair protein [Flavobacteriales bacterium]
METEVKNKSIQAICAELKVVATRERKEASARYFQTQPGGYGEGDLFFGATVPDQRKIAKQFSPNISEDDLNLALTNSYHEVRFIALIILADWYKKAKMQSQRLNYYNLYLAKAREGYINNWDLIDTTTPHIVGHFCYHYESADNLYEIAKEDSLWMQRIAVLGTAYFIKQKDFLPTLMLAEYFLNHPHHLMHKATGWMLREMGKLSKESLTTFLDEYHKRMPRTMLRYAIEKLTEGERQLYLNA